MSLLQTVLQSGRIARPEGATGRRWPHLQWVALLTLGGASVEGGSVLCPQNPQSSVSRGTHCLF